jgi:hypothetical protein
MNIFESFPSTYLKAADIDHETNVTKSRVQIEQVGDDEMPVLYLREYDKGIVLNKTNSTNIASLYGPETKNWIGKKMLLATAMVDYQGKSMKALRLYPPKVSKQVAASDDIPNPPAPFDDDLTGEIVDDPAAI